MGLTVEQVVAIIGALTALLVAATALLVQVHLLRKDLNGRVTQLLDAAGMAREKRGEMAGRDFMQRLLSGSGAGVEGSSPAPPNPSAQRGDRA